MIMHELLIWGVLNSRNVHRILQRGREKEDKKDWMYCGELSQKAFWFFGLAGTSANNNLQMPQPHHEGWPLFPCPNSVVSVNHS